MPFIPRLTKDGIYNNYWYYSGNIFYRSGNGLPNCTCYAYGRSAEIANQFINLPTGNAGDWWYNTTLNKGQNPALGAVGCWSSRSGDYKGHVAVVEQIINGGVIFSCSGYSRAGYNPVWNDPSYFWTESCYLSSGYQMRYMSSRDYSFMGFIYNPFVTGSDVQVLPDWIKGNRYLTWAEMDSNAIIVWSILYFKGWTREAVSALLGNMKRESTVNPGLWEGFVVQGRGFGLVQWTPYTNFTNWADNNNYSWDDGTAQLKWIDEVTVPFGQWVQTSQYPMSFDSFKISTASVEYLTRAFCANFERAGVVAIDERIEAANHFYEYLATIDPLNPGRIQDKTHHMPVWMMTRKYKFYGR